MNNFKIQITPPGSAEHLADLALFRAQGLPIPHHYSSWALHSTRASWRWCRALDSTNRLIAGFALELIPSRMLPIARIGRIDRIGRTLHAAALPVMGQVLTEVAQRVPNLLRLDVRVFDEDSMRREQFGQSLLLAGGHRSDEQREYSHTLLLALDHSDQALLAALSRRMRQDIRKFLKYPGTHIAPICDSSYTDRIRALHRSSFARTGAKPPLLDVEGILRDSINNGESILMGAFMAGRNAPNDLVAFAWGRLHGDHIVYEAGGLEKSDIVRHLSPGYGLIWHLVSWARSRNATWLDLGGIIRAGTPASDILQGIAAFKRRFSKNEQSIAEEFFFEPNTRVASLVRTARAAAARLNWNSKKNRSRNQWEQRSDSMRHEIIQNVSEFDTLEQDWTNLLLQSGRDLLPLSYIWTSAWWKNFGGKRQPSIHCFYEKDKLIAIAPMLIESVQYRQVNIRRMTSMANGHSPHSELLVDPNVSPEQLTEIIKKIISSTAADLTTFTRVPEDSPLYQLFHARSTLEGRPIGLKGDFTTPLVEIDSDWETFLGKRSQKFRKSIRNKVNRFNRAEGCSIERRKVISPDDPIMDEMILVSRNSWKGKAGTDLASMPGSRPFMADLIKKLGPIGGIQVWIARCGTHPIAYEFHASYQGVTYPLRADFDENYRELSPGSVVEYTALHDIFLERQFALYDSCANNYWYLSNWTSEYRKHLDIEIFSKTWKSRCMHAVEYRLIPLLRRCRDFLNKRAGDDTQSTSSK